MTNERLLEIKDSIDFQKEIAHYKGFDFLLLKEEIDLYDEVIRLQKNHENLIKYIEDKINMCDGYIDITKSDLEELKYTMFAHDKLKKTIDENIKARNIYQDLLERIKSDKYEK